LLNAIEIAESCHPILEGSPDDYSALADFLVENYAKKGVDVNKLVLKEMTRSTNLNDDQAFEEVIAESCESFLRDIHLSDKAEQLYKTDKGLATKIKNILNRILNALKKWYGVAKPQSVEANYVLEMKDALSEAYDKYIAGIRAASENLRNMETSNNAAKLQGREQTKKITLDMTDSERYVILKNRSIDNVPFVTSKSIENASINSWDDINRVLGKQKRQLIYKLAKEFGVFKDYNNSDFDLEFEFSHNDFRESFGKQKKYFADFTKMFSVFDDDISNAIGIEVHNRNKEGYKTDPTLNAVYVLVSAFRDGNNIIPVKLEIKEFKDKKNQLYVAISLKKVKATEVSKQGDTENGVTQNSRSVAFTTISIAQLFKNINPKDKDFIKYIPKQFFEDTVKRQSRSDADYLSAVERGDMNTAQRMVDEAAERAFAKSKIRDEDGKLMKVYHGTDADFTVFVEIILTTKQKSL